LLKTIPNDAAPDQPLFAIRGQVPSLLTAPTGCSFAPRCERAMAECTQAVPPQYELEADHHAACFLHLDRARTP
jgi:peptide/nickel transport system ATP-binding protein